MKKRVTIQDIADALGISRNTVSKAINNSSGLADSTRERILQKAVELGYKQFSYLETLNKIAGVEPEPEMPVGFVGEIALFTTVFLSQSHFSAMVLDRLQRDMGELGYTINTHRVTRSNLKEKTLPVTFRPDQTSAIICLEMFDFDYDEMVCDLGYPVLFLDAPAKIGGRKLAAGELYMANTTEIVRLVHDLVSCGKKRIGFIGDYTHCQSFYERYLAFRSAMLIEGCEVEERFVLAKNDSYSVRELLRHLDELPDVFICANDFVAIDAMRILSSMGKQVPRDIWISGFDDSPESHHTSPPLTTVRIHSQIQAFAAAHLILSRLREPTLDYRTMYTETNLVYRESTPMDQEVQ